MWQRGIECPLINPNPDDERDIRKLFVGVLLPVRPSLMYIYDNHFQIIKKSKFTVEVRMDGITTFFNDMKR